MGPAPGIRLDPTRRNDALNPDEFRDLPHF